MKKLSMCLTMIFIAVLAFSTISCSGEDKAPAPETAKEAPQAITPVAKEDAPQARDFMDDEHKGQAPDETPDIAPDEADEAMPGPDEEPEAQVEEGVIRMANPAYETHTRPIMNFFHERHYLQFNVSCGQCHHDEQGRPLNDLKEGDSVKSCIDCHSIPGQMPRDQKTALQNLPEEERLQKELAFHAEAIHKLCTDCHRARNQEQGKSTRDGAPTTCAQCHARE